MGAANPSSDFSEADRRTPRRAESAETMLVGPHSGRLPVQVKDISCGGFRCEGAIAFEPGTEVLLGIGGETVRAIIRWKRGSQIGCQFVEPLSDAAVERAFTEILIVRPNANSFRQRMIQQADAHDEAETALVPEPVNRPTAMLRSLRQAFSR